MSRLEIAWPDAGVERVRAARGRLERAGEALRGWPLEERLAAVARVLEAWTTADSPWRRELVPLLAAATPFEQGTIAEGLESGLRAWQPEAFIESARLELAGGHRELVPFDWTTVVAGGSIPMPTILSSLLPLVAGSPVLMRETSKDPVTAGLLLRSLEAEDERLARCFERVAFPADDRPAFAVAFEAPCVVASGSDETIDSISQRLRPSQRFVAYGHRFSVAVLGPELATNVDLARDAAAGIALDVARWDQSGCLSPAVVYLVDLAANEREAIAGEISEALEACSRSMPRGTLEPGVAAQHATERAEARMRQAQGSGLLFEGTDDTVVLEADARSRPAPLHRFLRLMPVSADSDLVAALTPFGGHLSNVAIAGLRSTTELSRALARLGVSRVTRPGRMQTPPVDWPHDGMPLFTPIARFVQSDLVRL